jgi:hypothetical protein
MVAGLKYPAVRWGGRRLLALAAAGLALALVLAACGQGPGSGIFTASESQQTIPANPVAPVDEDDANLVYAQCIRANGVPEFPDPLPDGRIMVRRGAGFSMNDPRYRAAQEACQDVRPPGLGQAGFGTQGSGDAETMIVFARCMRENGVPDFPDPGPDGGIRIVAGSGTGMDPNDPKFQAALRTCQASLSGTTR